MYASFACRLIRSDRNCSGSGSRRARCAQIKHDDPCMQLQSLSGRARHHTLLHFCTCQLGPGDVHAMLVMSGAAVTVEVLRAVETNTRATNEVTKMLGMVMLGQCRPVSSASTKDQDEVRKDAVK